MNFKNITSKLLTLSLLTTGAIFGVAKDNDSLVSHKRKCHTERCEKRHENRTMAQDKHFMHCRNRAVEGTVIEHKCHHEGCKHRIAGTDMCRHERYNRCQNHACQHKCHTDRCKKRHEERGINTNCSSECKVCTHKCRTQHCEKRHEKEGKTCEPKKHERKCHTKNCERRHEKIEENKNK